MKLNKEHYGIFAVLIVLIYFLGLFLYQLKFGAPHWITRINLLFGPLPFIFLILLIAAIVSIFVYYKFNWIVISLPFLWNLLLPLKADFAAGFRGQLIEFFALLFQGLVFFKLIIGLMLPLLVVVYLFVKNLRKVESKKYELAFAAAILIFFILRFVF